MPSIHLARDLIKIAMAEVLADKTKQPNAQLPHRIPKSLRICGPMGGRTNLANMDSRHAIQDDAADVEALSEPLSWVSLRSHTLDVYLQG